MIVTRARFLALVVLTFSPPAGAADIADALRAAERAVNEYMLRTQIIMSCHPVQTDADKAYFESGEAIGKATFEQLWAQFDAAVPARHADNGERADEIMKQMAVEADVRAEQRFQEGGCAALEDELKALQ